MIPAFVIQCPELGRDLSALRAAVPDARVWRAAHRPQAHEGLRGAYREIAQHARAERWPAIFLMEEDCAFTSHFARETWEREAEWAAQHGYNLVVGGCISAARPRQVRDGLFAVDRFKSSHCLLVLASAYPVFERLEYPADVSMGRLGARSVVTYPFVAVQAPGFSGHLQRHTDNLWRYARFEQQLATLARESRAYEAR